MSLDNVINSKIDFFNLLKNKNYILYFECYQLNKNYSILLSGFCRFDTITRDSYYLISVLKIIDIKKKSYFYKDIKVGSTIKIRKFVFDMINEIGINFLFDNYYELNSNDIFLFNSDKKDAYIKTRIYKI